jgi:Ca-activated chloride channel family protein
MDDPAKLPLLQKSLGLLVDELEGSDEVAIVVYAGASGVVLLRLREARRRRSAPRSTVWQAGGGTNGGEGLALAYKLAREHFISGRSRTA